VEKGDGEGGISNIFELTDAKGGDEKNENSPAWGSSVENGYWKIYHRLL
jgi:hypothetical protein